MSPTPKEEDVDPSSDALVNEYERAFHHCENREQANRELVQKLADAVQKLSGDGWKRFKVTGIGDVEYAFPQDIPNDQALAVNGFWPSVRELGEDLAAWHNARRQMLNAWNAVPEGSRLGLTPPE